MAAVKYINRINKSVERKNKMNKNTYYGEFGGQYVAETLMSTLLELEKAFEEAVKDEKFIADYD